MIQYWRRGYILNWEGGCIIFVHEISYKSKTLSTSPAPYSHIWCFRSEFKHKWGYFWSGICVEASHSRWYADWSLGGWVRLSSRKVGIWEKAQMEGERHVQGIGEGKWEWTGRNRGQVSACKTEEEGCETEARACSNSVGSRRVSAALVALGRSSLPSLTSSMTAFPTRW